jgi:hypothetical protein
MARARRDHRTWSRSSYFTSACCVLAGSRRHGCCGSPVSSYLTEEVGNDGGASSQWWPDSLADRYCDPPSADSSSCSAAKPAWLCISLTRTIQCNCRLQAWRRSTVPLSQFARFKWICQSLSIAHSGRSTAVRHLVALIQFYAGFDRPTETSVVSRVNTPTPNLRTIGLAGIRVASDWRHYLK